MRLHTELHEIPFDRSSYRALLFKYNFGETKKFQSNYVISSCYRRKTVHISLESA